jgi:predicted nucleotidyltransferase
LSQSRFNSPQFIYPAGTQIVTTVPITRSGNGETRPVGTVGVVLLSPGTHTGTYLVRFPDGQEIELKRTEFEVRKHFEQRELITAPVRSADFAQYGQFIIFRCIVGSRAYGLSGDESDVDRRGIYLPPAEAHWSLYGVPEQLESPETEETYWEIEKFIRLALKANPNVLECLYTPMVTYATPLAEELLSMRSIFLSRLVYQTYNGYVMSQFKKMQRSLANTGKVKWKHAMHLIRLLCSGITVLEEGFVPVSVASMRERLLAIKRGELTWEEVNSWRLDLHRQFDTAYEQTRLPERPDFEAADDFLIRARRSSADGH